MTHRQQRKYGFRKAFEKKGFLLTGAALLFAGAVLAYQGLQSSRPEPTAFLSLSGEMTGSVATSVLESRRNAVALVKTGEQFELPQSLAQTVSAPYRIRTSLETKDGDYRDMVLSVAKNGSLTVLVDGFDSYDEITLTLNNSIVYQNVPLDWSGRLELTADKLPKDPVNACIRIDGFKNSIGLCHTMAKRQAA